MQRINSSFGHARSDCQRASVRGFTLVELMITLVVLGVVMAIGIPSFRNMIVSSRVTSNTNEIVTVLQEARMEAIRRRARVVVCPTLNGSTCSGGNWGYLLTFVDRDNSNQAGAGEAVVRNTLLKVDGLTLVGSASISSDPRVWFNGDGLAGAGATAAPARVAALRVCSDKLASPNSRVISVNVSRVAVAPENSPNCAAPANPG